MMPPEPEGTISVEYRVEEGSDPCNLSTSKQVILEEAWQHMAPHLPSEFGDFAIEKGMAMLVMLFDALSLRPLTPRTLGLTDGTTFPKHYFWTQDVSSYLDVKATKQLLKCLARPQNEVAGLAPLKFTQPIFILSGKASIVSEYEFKAFLEGLYHYLDDPKPGEKKEEENDDWLCWMTDLFVVEGYDMCSSCVRE